MGGSLSERGGATTTTATGSLRSSVDVLDDCLSSGESSGETTLEASEEVDLDKVAASRR